jgi:hypothetical protein
MRCLEPCLICLIVIDYFIENFNYSDKSESSTGLMSVMIVLDIVRSAAFRVGVDGFLSLNFRYKIKPTRMQNETPQIVSMTIITIISFEFFGGFTIFGFGPTKPHFSVISTKTEGPNRVVKF